MTPREIADLQRKIWYLVCNTARSKDTGSDNIHAATDQIMSLIERAVADAEAAATLAERERCAAYIETLGHPLQFSTSAHDRAIHVMMRKAAAAIRNVDSIKGE